MDIKKTYEELAEAVSLTTDKAVLRISSEYEPAGGPGSKVYPPTFPPRDNSPYVIEERRYDGQERAAVLLDQVQSQANRAEEALLRARRSRRVVFPIMELHHSGAIDVVVTSLEFPHRYADAYLRDSLLGGTSFDSTSLGKSFLAASLQDASALYARDPGSLVYGAWNSHRKGRQHKFPRIYSSEIVGWDPVVGDRAAGRMDPLNLVGAAKPTKDGTDWDYAPAATKVKGEKLSEIGHGNIAPNHAHGGVTITSATRMATLSLAALDRIGFGARVDSEAQVAARTVLASFALLGDRLAFSGPSLWLRSGSELVLLEERLEWIHRGGAAEAVALTIQDAIDLFGHACERAAALGMPISTDVVALTPSAKLAKAIDFSLTKAESTGD